MSENLFTYARFFPRPYAPRQRKEPIRSVHRTTKQPWAEFCQAFAHPQDDLPKDGGPLGQSEGSWCNWIYPNVQEGIPFHTALVFDLGTYQPDARQSALNPDALPIPFVAHTEWESEIRLILPFADPSPGNLLTKPRVKPLERWICRAFNAKWATRRDTTKGLGVLWTYPPWGNDRRFDDAGKTQYLCAFRDAPLPTLMELLTLGERNKSARGVSR